MIVQCGTCGKEIDKPMSVIKNSKSGRCFCSKSCSAKHNNKVPKRKAKTQKCKKCNEVYKISLSRGSKYCSKCRGWDTDKLKEMTLKEYKAYQSSIGKHPSWHNSQIRSYCRSWNKDLKNLPCQMCHYSKHSEFAHIKAITSFDENTKLIDINDSSNILILCRNCHWEFDHGLLKLEDIPKRYLMLYPAELQGLNQLS